MSIEWHRVEKVEICLIEQSITLRSKEGYPFAKSGYGSKDELMLNANRCVNMMFKAKKDRG